MLIYNATGVTTTGQLRVTKSIGSLLFRSDVLIDAFTTETISIEIERQNGGNTVICTQLPLADFILGSVYGNASVFADGTLATCAVCELASGGLGIYLNQNEAILIKLESLVVGKTYSLHGVEEPVTTSGLIQWDRKAVLVGEVSRSLNVAEYESVVITSYSAISELNLTYSNGITCKMTKEELIGLSVDTDPILSVSTAGVVKSELTTKICYPLVGVTSLEIVKTVGTLVELQFRNEIQNY